jgi:peptidoglycan/xylan/chitin deacetylase (PgdA/CDA1 family)
MISKSNSMFVLSLDFELFWGITDQGCLKRYSKNILGEWDAVPEILKIFRRYNMRATWATVGMLMCKDYKQWSDLRPKLLPNYKNPKYSNYLLESVAKEHPKMFFARSLVESIIETPGQELGGHSYSHFYCLEPGVTTQEFSEDLKTAKELINDIGASVRSFVFPRNQYSLEFIKVISEQGYKVFRGNPKSILYHRGHRVIGGVLGRGCRLLDNYIRITGSNAVSLESEGATVNCPASFFLRPWSDRLSAFDSIRINRIKNAMFQAAVEKKIFHLWWHPHNFGINLDKNIHVLEDILKYYQYLNSKFGMESVCMGDFIEAPCLSNQANFK